MRKPGRSPSPGGNARKWSLFAILLVSAITASCVEQNPVGVKSLHRTSAVVSSDPIFTAWSSSFRSTPIQTQWTGGTDSREYRQYTGFTADAGVLAFASANPGRLYINGDEPDQSCIAAYDYAATYHDYVAAIRSVDPTAGVSPAGFAEPNSACSWGPHSTTYADQFYNAYIQRYGVVPPVTEWRFHDFGLGRNGDLNGWWAGVSAEAAWSVGHGAHMVLGSWGFLDWNLPSSTFLADMKQAQSLLLNDTRINQAVWWSYENTGYMHYLANADGSLTAEGQTYANGNLPPTDLPSSVTLVGSAGGHAKLQWSNSFAGWWTEAEIWVQHGAVGSYVYDNDNLVAPGGTQTTVKAYTIGDRVKGRARYYNRLGTGPWSSFSNVVLMH